MKGIFPERMMGSKVVVLVIVAGACFLLMFFHNRAQRKHLFRLKQANLRISESLDVNTVLYDVV